MKRHHCETSVCQVVTNQSEFVQTVDSRKHQSQVPWLLTTTQITCGHEKYSCDVTSHIGDANHKRKIYVTLVKVKPLNQKRLLFF